MATEGDVAAARIAGAQEERLRQHRVYSVVLGTLRTSVDDVRTLSLRAPDLEDKQAFERIAATIEGAMQSLRDMRPKFS